MADVSTRPFKRVLDPMDRVSEVLFGLIMVLTSTGSISIAAADQAQIRTMLIGALGCNLAWGIIDGGMYLMARLNEHGQKIETLRALRAAADLAAARQIIAETLPPLLASVLPAEQLELMRQKMHALPDPAEHPRVTADDWLGAAAVCLLVFLSTFPVVIPFLAMNDARSALRVSNAVAVAMMFVCGYAFGRSAGLPPWAMGCAMVVVGGALVGIAVALGG